MKIRTACLSVSFLLLAGCASHQWAPGLDAKGTFDETNARCSLLARNSGQGFYASGSRNFVAGAAVGNAVGNAIKAQSDYNDCMQANGWMIADANSDSAKRTQAAKAQILAIRDGFKACLEGVRQNPKYAPILSHLLDVTTNRYSYAQLSDNRKPTVTEAGLLISYGDESDKCRDAVVAQLSAIDPRAGQLVQKNLARGRDLNLALINRQLTWGDYSHRVQDIMQSPAGSGASAPPNSDASVSTGAPPNATPAGNTRDEAPVATVERGPDGATRFDQWQQSNNVGQHAKTQKPATGTVVTGAVN